MDNQNVGLRRVHWLGLCCMAQISYARGSGRSSLSACGVSVWQNCRDLIAVFLHKRAQTRVQIESFCAKGCCPYSTQGTAGKAQHLHLQLQGFDPCTSCCVGTAQFEVLAGTSRPWIHGCCASFIDFVGRWCQAYVGVLGAGFDLAA